MFTEGAIVKYGFSKNYSEHRDRIILREDFIYNPATNFFQPEVIPSGFETDNASVPDLFSWFIHPNDKRLREGAWHHDFVPQVKGYYMEKYQCSDEELFLANNLEFIAMAKKHGFPLWKRRLIFFAINNTKIARDIWARGGQLK